MIIFDDSRYASVVSCLDELSDIAFQERVWVRGEGQEISSFTETVCQLFDDSGIDDMLKEGRTVFSPVIDEKFSELSLLLNRIDGTQKRTTILAHPSWPEIRTLASDILHLLKQTENS